MSDTHSDDRTPSASTPDASPELLEALRREAEQLREEIRRHDHLYYVMGTTEISDAAYDEMFRRLRTIEEEHPALRTEDSPTLRVGGGIRDDLPTIAHAAPLLSLDSTQDPEEVRRFDERMRKGIGRDRIEYILEPKLDGLSIELVYENGVLARAVTRGNGREGEGVTENVRTIASVPLRILDAERPAPEFLAVRGEVLIALSDFEALNAARLEAGEEPYANPRNFAAGTVRQLDSSITASRPLDCLAYDILDVRGDAFRTDYDEIGALKAWGFKVPDRIQTATSVEEILEYHRAYGRDRDSLDYEIDGVVVKVNALDDRADLGDTSRHPRWAIAFKFEPRKEVTRIDRIAVQVGRSGVLTPVALLLPVDVGGVTVSRATLHNREELVRKDIREGDLVRVQRAGDVIPQVVEVIEEPERERSAPFEMPTTCPNCGEAVVVKGPFTYCPNRFGCSAQLKGRLTHFAARDALDIEGLGSETAALLVEHNLVHEPADLFHLSTEQILALPGFAQKSAENLFNAIQARRKVELSRFLVALGIPEVGVAVARDLATHFRGLEAILDAGKEKLQEVKGIGPKMAEQIVEFLGEGGSGAAIRRVAAEIEELILPEVAGGDGPLAGIRFVFTGGLESMTRSQAKKLVEGAGGRVMSSVSAETEIVVAGSDSGSKLTKAQTLGLTILDEDGFLAYLREKGIGA